MRKLELTDAECLLLDGKVNPEAQKIVDEAREAARFAPLGDFAAELIRQALKEGVFKWNHDRLSYCPQCKKSAGYAKYKSGYNRGRDNWKKPLSLGGYAFTSRCFITINGYPTNGLCNDCGKPELEKILKCIADEDLPIEIVRDENTKWVKEEIRECQKCKTSIKQFDMYLDHTIMGNGYFHSTCPHCFNTSALFSMNAFETKGFEMTRTAGLRRAGGCWTRHVSDVTGWEARQKHEASKKEAS